MLIMNFTFDLRLKVVRLKTQISALRLVAMTLTSKGHSNNNRSETFFLSLKLVEVHRRTVVDEELYDE